MIEFEYMPAPIHRPTPELAAEPAPWKRSPPLPESVTRKLRYAVDTSGSLPAVRQEPPRMPRSGGEVIQYKLPEYVSADRALVPIFSADIPMGTKLEVECGSQVPFKVQGLYIEAGPTAQVHGIWVGPRNYLCADNGSLPAGLFTCLPWTVPGAGVFETFPTMVPGVSWRVGFRGPITGACFWGFSLRR